MDLVRRDDFGTCIELLLLGKANRCLSVKPKKISWAACHSRCSVIHPVGDHNHRRYFLQKQKPVIRMERSTDFLG
jgi:hypothetical protein